jgi:hypothetical protein
MRLIYALACCPLLTGCLASDAESSESSTEQASTVELTDCAAPCAYNATEELSSWTVDVYAHVPPISCAQQNTIVEVTIDQNPIGFGSIAVQVPLWNLNVPQNQKAAECAASTLAVRIEQGPGTAVCGMTQVYYGESHPTWSNGQCIGDEIYVDVDPGRYVVRALAIDGIESDHHGYDGVQIRSGKALGHGPGWHPIP